MKRTCKVPSGSVVSFGAVNLNGVLPTIESYLRGRDAEILEVDRVRLCLGLYSVGLKGSKTKIVTTGTLSLARRNRKVEISNPANAAEFIIDEIEALR